MELNEARRLVLTSTATTEPTEKRRKLQANSMAFKVIAGSETRRPPGQERLLRFMRLLLEFDKVSWAAVNFDLNQAMIRRLTQSHLPVIVGEHYHAEKAALEAMCNAPDRASNVVWITNRQQGKTTTLSKFLAALMVLAPASGSLCCIYSTNYDRATELLKGAKMYLDSMGSLHPLRPETVNNNERSITLRTVDGYVHAVAARPRNPNSCRGDAPKVAMFDEIAFVQEDFWCVATICRVVCVTKRLYACYKPLLHMRQNKVRHATLSRLSRANAASLVQAACVTGLAGTLIPQPRSSNAGTNLRTRCCRLESGFLHVRQHLLRTVRFLAASRKRSRTEMRRATFFSGSSTTRWSATSAPRAGWPRSAPTA